MNILGVKLDEKQDRLWQNLNFLLRLLALSIPLYIITFFIDLYPLQIITAGQSGWLMSLLGWQVTQNGANMVVNGFAFGISADCTAWKTAVLFFALLFAVPKAKLNRRVLGLAIGIPIIWAANLVRIVGVVSAQQNFGIEVALSLHDVLWQLGLVALVLIMWAVWLRFSRLI